jgi:hypothetical protein
VFQQLDIAIAFVVVMLLLSLLVMAIVQAVSALFDLRGKNLVRALTDLLKQIDSGLDQEAVETTSVWWKKVWNKLDHPFTKVTLATKIADSVAQHPVLAQTFTRAKWVQKEELLAVLKDLCSENTIATIDPTEKAKLKEILAAQVPGGVATVATAQALAVELGEKFPGLKDQLDKVMTDAMGSVSRLEAGIEKWFDAVMDRSSDVFTRWTRTITVLVSVLFVILLQIDAGLILKQVSTDPGVRAGLVKLSDQVLTQADEALQAGHRGGLTLKALAEKHPNDPAASDLRNAPPLVTCLEGREWLEVYESKHPGSSDFQTEFNERCQEMTLLALRSAAPQIGSIRNELAATNLKIVPETINGEPVFGKANASFGERFRSWLRAYHEGWHLLGTLAMIVLLSLGAPFWFNALKQLSNLKPSVAQKAEKEASGSQS